MLRDPLSRPPRVLLTFDAVGGVWSYALDVARMLAKAGGECLLVGFGPRPAATQIETIRAINGVMLEWADEPLDWMVSNETLLNGVASTLTDLARRWAAEIVHLSAPAQAACLPGDLIVVAQSHSCVPSWWHSVRGGELPLEWQWQTRRNEKGLRRADIVVVPTASHGHLLSQVYGSVDRMRVIHNGTRHVESAVPRHDSYVFAAGRWWDEGKNATVLDKAARGSVWPILMAGALEGPNGAETTLTHARHLGHLSNAEMRLHLSRAGIFAAPSRYEPFGLAVLEAASFGRPLLLADIDTFRELWSGTALFVDPEDPDAWRHAIRDLALDGDQRQKLGVRARQRAADFSLGRQKIALLQLYQDALNAAETRVMAVA